ncbi:EPTC-inducible aldehyde dehydrogenase protein, partial [human gut metagenome]
ASSGKRDIDLALDAAHKVKDKWAHTSVQERAAILFKIADRMEQNLELLATAETRTSYPAFCTAANGNCR